MLLLVNLFILWFMLSFKLINVSYELKVTFILHSHLSTLLHKQSICGERCILSTYSLYLCSILFPILYFHVFSTTIFYWCCTFPQQDFNKVHLIFLFSPQGNTWRKGVRKESKARQEKSWVFVRVADLFLFNLNSASVSASVQTVH